MADSGARSFPGNERCEMSAHIVSREPRPPRSSGPQKAAANSVGGFRRTLQAREKNRAGRSEAFICGENAPRGNCESTFPATGNAPLCSGRFFLSRKGVPGHFASLFAMRIDALFGSGRFPALRGNQPLRNGSFRAFTKNARLRSGRIRRARKNRRGDSGISFFVATNVRAGSGDAFAGAGVDTLCCC